MITSLLMFRVRRQARKLAVCYQMGIVISAEAQTELDKHCKSQQAEKEGLYAEEQHSHPVG